MELDPSDPLYDVDPLRNASKCIPHRIALFAKVELNELTSRHRDFIYPPLTRLYLYVRVRTGNGKRAINLSNSAALDLGLSRWQKSRYLRRLEEAGLILVKRKFGCMPNVSIVT